MPADFCLVCIKFCSKIRTSILCEHTLKRILKQIGMRSNRFGWNGEYSIMWLIRVFMVALGKLIIGLMRLFHFRGGNLPGIILQALRKNCLEIFQVECPIIACTGTNGKTSVTNFIGHLFQKEGNNIITNPEGNNLDTGICSLLLKHCTMTGKVKADYLVLEVDESHVPVVFSQLKLESLVVLNFFRDQLDRNGEIETLILKVQRFCETFEGNLFLNGDDPTWCVWAMPIPATRKMSIISAWQDTPTPPTPSTKWATACSAPSARRSWSTIITNTPTSADSAVPSADTATSRRTSGPPTWI